MQQLAVVVWNQMTSLVTNSGNTFGLMTPAVVRVGIIEFWMKESNAPISIAPSKGHDPANSADTADPMVGILLRTRIGTDVYGTNTKIEEIPLGNLKAGK